MEVKERKVRFGDILEYVPNEKKEMFIHDLVIFVPHLKEEADKINAADALVFQTEKQLKEFGDKIPADKKQAIESSFTELKAAHAERNISGIDSAMERLNAAWQAASEDMYKAGGEQGADANANQNANPSGNGEATDVDFEEVKESK